MSADQAIPVDKKKFTDDFVASSNRISNTESFIAMLKKAGNSWKDEDENSKWCLEQMAEFDQGASLMGVLLDKESRRFFTALYLVLRVVDTVEDDSSKTTNQRIRDLATVHRLFLDSTWKLSCDYGLNDKERCLMQNVPKIRTILLRIPQKQQEIILKAAKDMSTGMTRYLVKDQSEFLIDDYKMLEDYCFVASGLVERAFREFMVDTGYADPEVLTPEYILAGGGWPVATFTQSVNILRDYQKDTFQPTQQLYWPKTMVTKYVAKQADLAAPHNRKLALACLNEFVAEIMCHALLALKCIKDLKSHWQVAIGLFYLKSLANIVQIYNNCAAFQSPIQPELSEMKFIFERSRTFGNVVRVTQHYCLKLLNKIPEDEHTGGKLRETVLALMEACDAYALGHCDITPV